MIRAIAARVRVVYAKNAVATMAKSRLAKFWKWSSSRRSGSHHSPQCHPVSHRYCSCGSGVSLLAMRHPWRWSRARSITKSTHATIDGHCSSSSRRSAYARHVSHGTSTEASPHPDDASRNSLISLGASGGVGSGAKLRTAPSLRWSAARSRSHLVENPATS